VEVADDPERVVDVDVERVPADIVFGARKMGSVG